MASQAPLHLQGFRLVHQRHLVDRAVTGVAADTLGDVNAVIEINEVRELVDARPLQRFAGAIAGADGLKQLSVRPDLRVAVHARLGRGNSRETGSLDRGVTVAAVDAESGDVMLMAEWNRLGLADAGIGHKGRALHHVNNATQCRNDKHCTENGGAGQRIRAAMKDLRHSLRYEIWMKRPGSSAVSASVIVPEIENHPQVFCVVGETGNYKYFAEVCRAFLEIRDRKKL